MLRVAWSALLVLLAATLLPLRGEERMGFIGVALDLETRQADKKLQDHLATRAGISFAPEELEYEEVIKRLAQAKADGAPLLARATPYVFVAAEMLGADLEVLGTYLSSATGRTTYRSYFVVGRRHFPGEPALPELYAWLRQRRARFVYHSPFSTSSFFLPSLYFRAQKLFHMPENTESLWAMDCVRIQESSSSRLVQMVAQGEADLASVWDGTRNKFLKAPEGAAVHFVPLPAELPNDLLVCSRSLDPKIKEALRAALRDLGPEGIALGDFRTWRIFDELPEARKALADLRWQARDRPAPVTVEVRMRKGAEYHPRAAELMESVRQSIRLAATELVPYDRDFHEHLDYAWTLEPVHDGALVLHSAVPGFDVDEQAFRVSFRAADDLTLRIISLIHGRLHRIRMVWPYSSRPPIVMRDTAFTVPTGSVIHTQRVTWLDPERNKFRSGPILKVRVDRSDYYRYELNPDDLKDGTTASPSPLSNEAYRVLLSNPTEGRVFFQVLTWAMLLLLAAATGAAGLAAFRRRVRRDPEVPS